MVHHQAGVVCKTAGKGLLEGFYNHEYRNGVTLMNLLAIQFRSTTDSPHQ